MKTSTAILASIAAVLLPALLAALLPHSQAQAQGTRIYRCGNEYTNAVSNAAARGCQLVEGGNVTVIQSHRPSPPSSGNAPRTATTSGTASSATASATRIDSGVQRSRDQEARQILQAELQKNQTRLQQLQSEYKGGQPDRLGNERNYQLYIDRTARLKNDIERTQSDIEGIQREINRLTSGG